MSSHRGASPLRPPAAPPASPVSMRGGPCGGGARFAAAASSAAPRPRAARRHLGQRQEPRLGFEHHSLVLTSAPPVSGCGRKRGPRPGPRGPRAVSPDLSSPCRVPNAGGKTDALSIRRTPRATSPVLRGRNESVRQHDAPRRRPPSAPRVGDGTPRGVERQFRADDSFTLVTSCHTAVRWAHLTTKVPRRAMTVGKGRYGASFRGSRSPPGPRAGRRAEPAEASAPGSRGGRDRGPQPECAASWLRRPEVPAQAAGGGTPSPACRQRPSLWSSRG